MHTIVFDLEFNQDPSSINFPEDRLSRKFPEIIQIGAVKLDEDLNMLASFNRYVKPHLYSKLSPFVAELTGITTEQLLKEECFPQVYKSFIGFIDGIDSIFCTWGLSDMKEIYRNADFYSLDLSSLPKKFINLQPYTSSYLGLHKKRLLQLQKAVEALNILKSYPFHDALSDALYTSEILRKINSPDVKPILYDPSFKAIRRVRKKTEIDFVGLIHQFEKMQDRSLSDEEQRMIKLAYQMGRTHQFVKEIE